MHDEGKNHSYQVPFNERTAPSKVAVASLECHGRHLVPAKANGRDVGTGCSSRVDASGTRLVLVLALGSCTGIFKRVEAQGGCVRGAKRAALLAVKPKRHGRVSRRRVFGSCHVVRRISAQLRSGQLLCRASTDCARLLVHFAHFPVSEARSIPSRC